MTDSPKPAVPQVNPIVQAAADQVTGRKRRTRKDLHAPCWGQMTLFDSTAKADR
ncbi:hypothetical protein OHA40_16755 [Nocardia sp. NBC_00508]|uniref:hypothetical protein n=1 Tax=Nocardia sp. NBC_00508 TaxID=2975992 RepID=UPI002E7FCA5D|nr:hypothetical protein [Nocardia sp. NBC_00508]WUD69619.1 hypothetical protein OHA40_16755 [Nocardia sp. NBC_00508]